MITGVSPAYYSRYVQKVQPVTKVAAAFDTKNVEAISHKNEPESAKLENTSRTSRLLDILI